MAKIELSLILFIFYFMTILSRNIFIYFLSLAVPRMGTLFVYIHLLSFIDTIETEKIFLFSYLLFIFVHLFIFIIVLCLNRILADYVLLFGFT